MAKNLALSIFLNGKWIGTTELCTIKTIHVNDHNKVRSNTLEEEIKEAICAVCFARKDDLLATHSLNEFTVKGTLI